MKLDNNLYKCLHSIVFDSIKYSVEDYESLYGIDDSCVCALSGVTDCISVLKVMEDAKVDFGQVHTFELSSEQRAFVVQLLEAKLINLAHRVRNLCDGVSGDKLADQLYEVTELFVALSK